MLLRRMHRAKPRLLLVDDSDAVRTALASMLAPRYEVRTASTASEALDLLRASAGAPVIVSDQEMPGGSGLELLQRVRAEWPETIGILLTGRVDAWLAQAAVQGGHVFRLLTKPCSFETLSAAIDAALARHDELEQLAVEEERAAFEHASLRGLHGLLEERVELQMQSLVRLNELAVRLNGARSLQDIAHLLAQSVHELLSRRSAHVQVWGARRDAPTVESSAGGEMSAHLALFPITTVDGPIGEIAIDAARSLTKVERTLLESACAAAAVAAHNELRRMERDATHQALILGLASLAEARDQVTGRHLERVAAYCRLIAEELRADGRHAELLDDGWIDDLARASPLHDIGKVGVPDSILLKPGRLSSAEWEVMKRHSELGARTLERVLGDSGEHRILQLGHEICWCHHERWDGSGYPRGLAGEAIPLSARILALADVYDALTSARPYKHPWTHVEAVEWIREHAGKHFAPDVADAILRREGDAAAIRSRLADDPDPRANADEVAERAA
ncbi:MAG: HD domain-containing protein [Planctomycetes bacterium]|nr:HD domain-containing protein [Planctomycetota bacterium]